MRITLFLHNWAKRALIFFLLSLHFVFSYVYLCVDYVSALLGCQEVAWENSRLLATLPPVSPPNDVWQTSAEIPYWWRVTTQISVVLLIGWIKFPTLHDQTRHRYGISALVSQTSFGGETSDSVAKCRLFSLASQEPKNNTTLLS